MKRQLIACLLAASMTAALAGCGSSKTENENSTEAVSGGTEVEGEAVANVAVYTYDTPASSTFNVNQAELVTRLGDYMNCEITLDKTYEANEENMNAFANMVFTNAGADMSVEVTDRDTVEEGDYVLLDYTGYLNDEAFDGGHAENQMIDVSGNCAVNGSGFIPGFTDCLIGAKVGETVAGNVTFPENYGNEDLKGQETVFEFNVHGIYQAGTLADLNDKQVADAFGDTIGLSTVEELKSAIIEVMTETRNEVAGEELVNYMIENSEVEVPEDYLEARLNEFIYTLGEQYCQPGQTIQDYFEANGTTLETQMESLRNYMIRTIKFEGIFLKIAELENLEVSDEEFSGIVTSFIQADAEHYADENALYEDYGFGDTAYGKQFLHDQIVEQKGLDFVTEKAAIIYE